MASRWTATLLAVAFLDEFASGIVPSGAPEVLAQFDLTPGQAAGWTIFALIVLGIFLEPPLLAYAQGRRARPMMLVGLSSIGVVCLVAAAAPTFWILLLALLFYGPASGLGVHLAEVALMTERAHDRESTLARWMLFGLIGDLLAPAALAASVALGYGIRGALLVAGVLALVQAFAAWRAHPKLEEEEEDAKVPVAQAFREGFRSRPLVAWTFLALVCALLDEILVSFGALHLEQNLGATPSERAVNFAAWVMGGVLGTVILERLGSKVRPAVLLIASGAGSALFYALWLFASSWMSAAVLLGVCGLFSAMHYPLITARAYASLPERPNTVAALGSLVSSLDVVAPLLVAFIADQVSLFAAVAFLLLQPVLVLLAGLRTSRGPKNEPRKT